MNHFPKRANLRVASVLSFNEHHAFVLARTRDGEMGLSIAFPLPAWEGAVAQATHYRYTTLF